MKYTIYLTSSLLFFASCSSMSKTSSSTGDRRAEATPPASPKFLEGITVSPGSSTARSSTNSTVYKPAPVPVASSALRGIEASNSLQFKYSILMNLPVESISNEKLFGFLEDWYGAPYRYGGTTKTGVDCSAFTGHFMNAVYGITLPRNSREQYSVCKKIKRNDLREGDLVFFKTRSTISHVGVYLGNNKFAHASTSSGVMISDLDEEYFARRYAGSGRIL